MMKISILLFVLVSINNITHASWGLGALRYTKNSKALITQRLLSSTIKDEISLIKTDSNKLFEDVQIGKKYRHYKGGEYKVVTIARYSENPQKEFVIYEALYESPEFGLNSTWARDRTMFTEDVVIDGKKQKRFQVIE